MRLTVIDTPQLPDGQETVLLDTHGVPAGLAVLSLLGYGSDDISGLGHVWFGRYRSLEDPFTLVGDALQIALYETCPAEPGDHFDFPLATVIDAADWMLDERPRFRIAWWGNLLDFHPVPEEITVGEAAQRRRAVWSALCLPGLSASDLSAAMRYLQDNGPYNPTWCAVTDPYPLAPANECIEGEEDEDPCQWPDDEIPKWSVWRAVRTSVGKARYRSKTTWFDSHYDEGVFEIAFDGRVWRGSDSGCVTGEQSYSVDGIAVLDSPNIDLKGQEHAGSLAGFVCYALPYLVTGAAQPMEIGQPVDD